MNIKSLLFAGMLAVGTVFPDNCQNVNPFINEYGYVEFVNPLSSGADALDNLEINKLCEYQDKFVTEDIVEKFSDVSQYKFPDKEMIIIQRFMGKGMGLALRIGMTISQLDERCDDERDFALDLIKAILNIIETDPEFTGYVKYPLIYLSKKADELIKSHADFDDLIDDELIGYVPQVTDAVTALLEYDVWSRAYLKQQYAHNGVVTAHDLAVVVQWLATFFDFPEKSKAIWFDYIAEVLKGANELPQEVHAALNDVVVAWLEHSEYDNFITTAIEANNLRKELAKKAQTTRLTQQDLNQYSSALDAVFEKGNMFEGSPITIVKQAGKQLPLLEKIIFKN